MAVLGLSPIAVTLIKRARDASGLDPIYNPRMNKALNITESTGLGEAGDLVVPQGRQLEINMDMLRSLDDEAQEFLAARAVAMMEQGDPPLSTVRNIPEKWNPKTLEAEASVNVLRPDVMGPITQRQAKGAERLGELDAELKALMDAPEGTTPGNIAPGYAPQFAGGMREAYDVTRSQFPAAGRRGVPGGGEQAAAATYHPNVQNAVFTELLRRKGLNVEPQEFVGRYGYVDDPKLLEEVVGELGSFPSAGGPGEGILQTIGRSLGREQERLRTRKGDVGDLAALHEQAKTLGPTMRNFTADNALSTEAYHTLSQMRPGKWPIQSEGTRITMELQKRNREHARQGGLTVAQARKGVTTEEPRPGTYDPLLPGQHGTDPEFAKFVAPTLERGAMDEASMMRENIIRQMGGEVGVADPRGVLGSVNRQIKEQMGEDAPGIAARSGDPAEFLKRKELMDVLDDMNVTSNDLAIVKRIQNIDNEIASVGSAKAAAIEAQGSGFYSGGRGVPQMNEITRILNNLKAQRVAALKEIDPRIRLAVEDAIGSTEDLVDEALGAATANPLFERILRDRKTGLWQTKSSLQK